MTKKPNKEKKPKLFEDYLKVVRKKSFPPRDINEEFEMEDYTKIEMLNDLATQIHELNKRVDELTTAPSDESK